MVKPHLELKEELLPMTGTARYIIPPPEKKFFLYFCGKLPDFVYFVKNWLIKTVIDNMFM
jgi:hypothetical protein